MSQNQEGMKGHNCHVSLKGWGGPGLALGWHGMEKHSLETSLGLGFQSLFKIPSNLRAPNGLFGYSWTGSLCTLCNVPSSDSSAGSFITPRHAQIRLFLPKICKRGTSSSPAAVWGLWAAVESSSLSPGRVSRASSSADSSGWLLPLKQGTIRSL